MDLQSVHSKDSYTERRKLFKNIWDTAIHLDEKDKDKEPENVPAAKPKVIKTLRLGDMDCINVGKNKRQRIKNLRTVCTKLLDICDRQEAEDVLYDQISAARQDSSITSIVFTHQRKVKKKPKKKKKAKPAPPPPSVSPDPVSPVPSYGVEVTEGPVTHRGTRPLRDMSSLRIERANLIQQFLNERYILDNLPEPTPEEHEKPVGDAHCKVKKKYQKRRPVSSVSPKPTSAHASDNTRRVATRRIKKKRQNEDIPSE